MTMLPLVAVSTKAYFGVEQSLEWIADVAENPALANNGQVELAVFPSFPILAQAREILRYSRVKLGAQDVAPYENGAQTGEVRASMLKELGCVYCEVGHAERRTCFGETDTLIAAKVQALTESGIIPLLCVGETHQTDPTAAGRRCIEQIRAALARSESASLVVAYEPVWAIGAERAAEPDYVTEVASSIHRHCRDDVDDLRVIYGGTAGPGLIGKLGPSVDGLFLGRRAHKVSALAEVIGEAHERRVSREERSD